jgi:hypothetical protein
MYANIGPDAITTQYGLHLLLLLLLLLLSHLLP